jgi:hypothetical protein
MNYYPQQLINRGLWFTDPPAPIIAPFGGSYPSAQDITILGNGGQVVHPLYYNYNFSLPFILWLG